jgi:GNAT superfamily N-acetyltransferase
MFAAARRLRSADRGMAARALPPDRGGMPKIQIDAGRPTAPACEVEVRDARGGEIVAGCALVARSLAFSDRDALPPWLVQTVAENGGLALVALAGGRPVGFSFALPAGAGELFSCGLAVERAWRGRGVGRLLKLAQRERALALGVRTIRWTADPLSARALALYLGGLGARLVAYRPELYAAVRPSAVAADDVLIEWSLTAGPARPGRPAARVEIPLDPTAPALARRRLEVRRAMTAALAGGGVGVDVALDRAAGRAYVLFAEAA